MNEPTFQALDAELPDAKPGNDHPYVTEEISRHWLENSRWTFYLAVFGYAMLVFIIVAFIFLSSQVASLTAEILESL